MDRIQEYTPGDPHKDALWILEDIMKEGVSQGWQGSLEDQLNVAGILHQFGVYYIGGLMGEWRQKVANKMTEQEHDEILMDLCQEIGVEGMWRDVSGFKELMADYLADEIEEEYEARKGI